MLKKTGVKWLLRHVVCMHSEKNTADGQNNGNTTQYRNKTVCVGYIEITSVLSGVILLFIYLRLSASVNARKNVFSNSSCDSTAKWGTCHFFRGTAFSWSICNQYSNFYRCVQSSIVQGHASIHKSWKESATTKWRKTKNKVQGSL